MRRRVDQSVPGGETLLLLLIAGFQRDYTTTLGRPEVFLISVAGAFYL